MGTDAINDKIEKLWKLLDDHNKALQRFMDATRLAIENRDLQVVGELSGQLVVIGQSDVCYAMIIEVLEDLKKR